MSSSIEGNKTINKMLHLLDIFLRSGRPLALGELADLSGLPRASLYRILNPMLKGDYLFFDSSSRLYGPGGKLRLLGRLACQVGGLEQMFPEILDRVHRQASHTVLVAQLSGGHILYTQKKEKDEGLKISLRLGVPYAAGHGILGRLILAYQPEDEARRLLESDPPASWQGASWPGWEAAAPLLRQIRAQGHASGQGERDRSTSVLGVPLFDGEGKVSYALGMLIPTMLFNAAEIKRGLDILRVNSAEISRKMGYLADK